MCSLLVRWGYTRAEIRRMSVLEFKSAFRSMLRARNADKVEDFWSRAHAAQAPVEDMKKFAKRWEDRSEEALQKRVAEDTERLIQRGGF